MSIVIALMIGGVSAAQKKTTTAATGKGEIEIATPSSESVVWIDGVSRGKVGNSRKFAASIPAGSHQVRVRTVGFEDWNRQVVVSSARPADVLVTQTRLNNNDALLHLQKGDAFRENNQQDQAVDEYHIAIQQRNGTYPEAYIGLSRSLFARGGSEDAEEAAKTAIKQKPTSAEAHTVLANLYRHLGDYDTAAKEYEESIKLARGFSPEGHTGLALTYKEIDRIPDAIREMQIGIKQNADTEPLLYYLIGDLYEKQQDNAKAVAAYETYLRLAPDGKLATALKSMIPQMKKDIQVDTGRPEKQ
jgi:tetratricopeptide (TPR) repeat protein